MIRSSFPLALALAQQTRVFLFCCVAPALGEPPALIAVYPRRPDVVIPASDRTLSPLAARLTFRTRLGTAILSLAAPTLPGPRTHDQYGSQSQTAQGSTNKPWKNRKLKRHHFSQPRSLLVYTFTASPSDNKSSRVYLSAPASARLCATDDNTPAPPCEFGPQTPTIDRKHTQ